MSAHRSSRRISASKRRRARPSPGFLAIEGLLVESFAHGSEESDDSSFVEYPDPPAYPIDVDVAFDFSEDALPPRDDWS